MRLVPEWSVWSHAGADRRGWSAQGAKAYGPNDNEYQTLESGNHVVMGPRGLPILKPPYSEMVAVDMNRGEHLWRIPLGPAPASVRTNRRFEG